MEKEELFRIFDACQPTVTQVREYLKRISDISPFDLIFRKDGKETITKKIAPNMGELVGIVVEKNVFFVKPMSFDDVKDLNAPVTAETVFDFGKKIYSKAIPLNENVIQLLKKNKNTFLQVAEILEIHGYSKQYTQDQYLLFSTVNNKSFGDGFDFDIGYVGEVNISYFLESHGNIYFYASIQ